MVVNNSVEITRLELVISCGLGIIQWSLLRENRSGCMLSLLSVTPAAAQNAEVAFGSILIRKASI